MHTLSPVFVNLVFFSLPSHIITPCVSPSEVYMRAVTSARRHSKHCTLSLVWLSCAGAASDWWGSLVVPRMRLLNAFVYVMGNGYLDSHCVSFYSNDVYRKEKKKSRCVKWFLLRLIWNNAVQMQWFINFETKGVLFMVMPNPFLQCTAVKTFIYYNATFEWRYLFFILSGQAIVKWMKGFNKAQ